MRYFFVKILTMERLRILGKEMQNMGVIVSRHVGTSRESIGFI